TYKKKYKYFRKFFVDLVVQLSSLTLLQELLKIECHFSFFNLLFYFPSENNIKRKDVKKGLVPFFNFFNCNVFKLLTNLKELKLNFGKTKQKVLLLTFPYQQQMIFRTLCLKKRSWKRSQRLKQSFYICIHSLFDTKILI
ncbi:hypothetical protein RFI_17145, partial [Reticulomyxa filosa]